MIARNKSVRRVGSCSDALMDNFQPVPYGCARCGHLCEIEMGGFGYGTAQVRFGCPVCGGWLRSIGNYLPRFGDDNQMVMVLEDVATELRAMPAGVPLEEILSLLDLRAPQLRPLTMWVREHHVELSVGLSAAGLLLAVLMELLRLLQPAPPAAPAPAGVTYEQMHELLEELRRGQVRGDDGEPGQRNDEDDVRSKDGGVDDAGPRKSDEAGREDQSGEDPHRLE